MTIEQREAQFIEDFNGLDDWMFQFDYLLMQTVLMEELPDIARCKENCVKGCQSKVWIAVDGTRDQCHICGDSPSLLVKGLLGVLIQFLNGHSREAIMEYKMKLVEQTSLREQLSPERHMGMESMLRHIKRKVSQCI